MSMLDDPNFVGHEEEDDMEEANQVCQHSNPVLEFVCSLVLSRGNIMPRCELHK